MDVNPWNIDYVKKIQGDREWNVLQKNVLEHVNEMPSQN